jgi:hypothetical protein
MHHLRYKVGLAAYAAVNVIVIPATLLQHGVVTHSDLRSDCHMARKNALVFDLVFLSLCCN